MLADDVHTDITINASDGGRLRAHRAVLATRSPVFWSMFSHDLKEKELSTIDISDMSTEPCQAFLNYIYGDIRPEEFLVHRLALLRAADKYDIADLKEACHDSLLEDIDAKNVLERLQTASLYRLPQLKSSCLKYLVRFAKVFDIREEFNAFLQCADRELIAEVFQEVLAAWKGFWANRTAMHHCDHMVLYMGYKNWLQMYKICFWVGWFHCFDYFIDCSIL